MDVISEHILYIRELENSISMSIHNTTKCMEVQNFIILNMKQNMEKKLSRELVERERYRS